MSAVVRIAIVLLAVSTLSAAHSLASEWQARADWSVFFNRFDASGTIAVLDERVGSKDRWVFNVERAGRRYSPASTFKIPHALFALDSAVVRDEFQVFPWDGELREYKAWNQHQNLRSSMRNSVVWVYQWIAARLGESRARAYLNKIDYGNADPSSETDAYWIGGELKISAFEQIAFLEKLYQNKLPFDVGHQRLVKDIMVVAAEKNWILRAKSGWAGRYGWWVGWVERPEGPVFFALNIDTPNRLADLPKRQAITREVLHSIGALPPAE